jgi:LAO/AO transport system kinase
MSRAHSAAGAGSYSNLLEGLLQGEPMAVARAITVVENGLEGAAAILSAIQPHLGKATVVGVTGPPGVGKSTLIDALITELRRRGKTVGVLAVDPTSPLTGGAILGDRIRMESHSGDKGVFVRSLASRGHLGGLFRTAWGVIQVMDAAGPDLIIIETVGAGQSEVEIAEFAKTRIVVCAPGLGDDIQAIKAGVLEIADILVVNKSDQPQAENTVRQLRAMLDLRDPMLGSAVIVSTTATTGQGIPLLADTLTGHAANRNGADRRQDPRLRVRDIIAELAADLVRDHIRTTDDPAIMALCDRVNRGEIDVDAAAAHLLKIVLDRDA